MRARSLPLQLRLFYAAAVRHSDKASGVVTVAFLAKATAARQGPAPGVRAIRRKMLQVVRISARHVRPRPCRDHKRKASTTADARALQNPGTHPADQRQLMSNPRPPRRKLMHSARAIAAIPRDRMPNTPPPRHPVRRHVHAGRRQGTHLRGRQICMRSACPHGVGNGGCTACIASHRRCQQS
jgi:hypothetical protein